MVDYTSFFKIFDTYEKEGGAVVSHHAKNLIMHIVLAVEEDANPEWKLSEEGKHQLTEGLISSLPSYLGRISKEISHEKHGRNEITSFDVLHWLALNMTTLWKGWPFSK